MKKAYLTNGILFKEKEIAIIFKGSPEISGGRIFSEHMEPVTVDKIYVDGDFNNHDLITVQLGTLSNGLEPEDINCYSHFEINVYINENEDPILTIKDRAFKLEHLSMELQERIHKVANEMYEDKMKTIVND